ncbi:uncharacterized protein LOC123878587 isoform X2 [Maniola jurtina]|nr:uncharacterized protein LOC123878587 isoform X2 [Maniola jurtina]
MSCKRCCVPGCARTAGTDNALHNFPDPAKDLDRFMTWIQNIGGDISKLSSMSIHKNRRVCRRHFEAKYLCRFNRINKIAVPTLNMPCMPESTDSGDFCETSASLLSSTGMPESTDSGDFCETSASLLSSTDSHPEPNDCDQQQQSNASERVPTEDNTDILDDLPKLTLNEDAVSSTKNNHACSMRKPPTIKLVRRIPATSKKMQGPRKKTLKEAERKIRDLQLEILRLRKRCKFLASRLEDAKKLTDNKTIQRTTNITLPPKIFTRIYVTRADLSHRNSQVPHISI